MAKCIVCGYSKYERNKLQERHVSFHVFPKDPVRRREWIKFVDIPKWQPTSKSIICSKHFAKDCYDKTSAVTRLKSHAVPTIYYQPSKQEDLNNSVLMQENLPHASNNSEPRISVASFGDMSPTTVAPSPPSVTDSPKEIALKRIIDDLYEKDRLKSEEIRNLQHENWQLKKKIDDLNSSIAEVRNKNHKNAEVECMLGNNDVMCNHCMSIFDDIANLKRKIFYLICKQAKREEEDNMVDSKFFQFNKIWSSFVSNLNIPHEPDRNSPSSPSPNNLLIQTHSVPEDQRPDMDPGKRNKRSATPAYSYYRSDTPVADREIQEVFKQKKKRKRRRKQSWTVKRRPRTTAARSVASTARSTASTTRKRSKRTRSKSNTGTSLRSLLKSPMAYFLQMRSQSVKSGSSYQSLYRPQSRSSVVADLMGDLRFDEGRLLNKRTRRVSRMHNRFFNWLTSVESNMFVCHDPPCNAVWFDTLDEITEHKITVHNKMAFYWCNECKKHYMTQEDLARHNKMFHDYIVTYCPICSEATYRIEDLQKHLNEHLIHSISCIYCDKSFLSKRLCENHIQQEHKGKKRKIRLRRPQSILDRVVSEYESSESDECPEPAEKEGDKEEGRFYKVLIQGNRSENDEDRYSCTSPTSYGRSSVMSCATSDFEISNVVSNCTSPSYGMTSAASTGNSDAENNYATTTSNCASPRSVGRVSAMSTENSDVEMVEAQEEVEIVEEELK